MTELSREYFARDKKRYWRFYWILVPILHFLFHPVVHGSENIPDDGPLIFTGNHRAWIDPAFLAYGYRKREMRFMAAIEYYGSILNFFFKAMLTIPVDRSKKNPESRQIAERVLEEGGVIGIFPEGKVNKTSTILLPLKYGAVTFAQKSGAKIIPCAITGRFIPFFSRIHIYYGSPLTVHPEDDLTEKNELLHQTLLDMYVEHARHDSRVVHNEG